MPAVPALATALLRRRSGPPDAAGGQGMLGGHLRRAGLDTLPLACGHGARLGVR